MSGNKSNFYVDIMAYHPEVTGSLNFLVIKFPDGITTKFIVDCGLFHEKEYLQYNKQFPFNAETIDFVLVTHNHIDHIGRLPLLVKSGYQNKIYMTNTTSKLIRNSLSDSQKVLKNVSKRNNEKVLYSDDDVRETLGRIVGVEINKEISISSNILITFLSNGHLPGAAVILVKISYPGYEDINLLFTGDYNNKNMFFDVEKIPEDIKKLPLTIIQESTYGDMDSTKIKCCYEDNISKAINEAKTVVSPVFSLGRTQEILYVVKRLQDSGILSKDIPVYLDGNLAIQYTEIYKSGKIKLKDSMRDFLPNNFFKVEDLGLRSNLLVDRNPKIILTTSGMGSYGPAQTYIPEYLSRRDALIHFTGYTAEGTLGEKLRLTPKGEAVNVSGLVVVKRANVEYTCEYSAHAKADEMIEFLKQFTNIKLILVNHGEKHIKDIFAKRILKEVKTKHVGILGNSYFFRIDPYGLVKTMVTKFN